jgi:tight adherence protein C
MDQRRLLWLTSFAAAFLLAYGVILYCASRRQSRLRLRHVGAGSGALAGKGQVDSFKRWILDLLQSSGHWASRGQAEGFKVRDALIQAGFRHLQALAFYYGLRVFGALLLPFPYFLLLLIQKKLAPINLLVLILLSGAGFYLPYYLLLIRIRKRQARIDKALPDVLDLLIICMEAGLALQAAINRIAEEIRWLSQDLCTELQILGGELRTGLSRETALQNLGQRTGVENVQSLVALMIQSERMGASIADALRIQADFVRDKRLLTAEEMAGKLAVKILFPLFLFIFPAIIIVILGPAAIRLFEGFLK